MNRNTPILSAPLMGQHLAGLADIVSNYDVYIIDLWGVIYNGKEVFKPALETLKNLRKQGKIVYLTTNNPRARPDGINFLSKQEITPDLYSELITAGQKTLELFKMRIIEPEKKRPLKTFFIDHGELCGWAEEAQLIGVNEIEEADIILATHMDENHLDVTPYMPLFCHAIERNITLVCANPDKYIIQNEHKKARVGLLSELYHKMGGRIIEVGKPHPIMFEEVMMAHAGKPALLIGDSLVTDIHAAANLKIDSLFIMSGYHSHEIHIGVSLSSLYQHYGIAPTYVCEQLYWR